MLVTLRFSRAQFGTHLGYFESISGVLWKTAKACKCLSDAGLGLVPGGGIEPSTHGFSVPVSDYRKYHKCFNYRNMHSSSALVFIGKSWLLLAVTSTEQAQSKR